MTAAFEQAPAAGSQSTVRVELGARSYDVVIGAGVLDDAGRRIARLRPKAAVIIITDANVERLHLPQLRNSLVAAKVDAHQVVVPAGEDSKSFPVLQQVLDAILAARLERGDLVIALGGGVIGDLAGLAAAVARRGMDYVQIPTTLLAQVDSAVGGKTAVNSKHGKNLIGAFHQPILVLSDTDLLDTLPAREFRAGYAEVAKYGLINDAAFFHWLEQNWREVFAGGPARIRAVATSCKAKAAIVSRDERESGERALLNLGHTFGHALEAATGFSDRLLHGEAIAIGAVLAFRFSAKLGLCDPADAERVAMHYTEVGLPTRLSQIAGGAPEPARLLDVIAQDKKVKRGALVFVLARGIGKAFVEPGIEPSVVETFLGEALRT